MLDARTINRLKEVAGPNGWTDNPSDISPHLVEDRGRWRGQSSLLLKPKTTAEVAAILKTCHETGTPVVPQGGNTGLVLGSVPDDSGREVVLSLGRMNRIRAVDVINNTMTVDAGCILAQIQNAAAEAGRLFPLSLEIGRAHV